MSIISRVKRLFNNTPEWKSYLNNLKYNIPKSALINEGFRIVHQEPPSDRVYVQVGEKSILQCAVIFETNAGSVRIGKDTYVGDGSRIISIESVEIGDDVMISWGVTIYDHDGHSINWEKRKFDVKNSYMKLTANTKKELKNLSDVARKKIIIGNRCWIGFDSIILKGVTLGEGTIVGAGSVVTKSFPPYVIVAGNPARIVKRLVDL